MHHFLFNHLGWLLLPEKSIIDIYYNALSIFPPLAILGPRGSFPVIEVRLLFMNLPQSFHNLVISERNF